MATSPQNKTARKEDLISGLPAADVKQMLTSKLVMADRISELPAGILDNILGFLPLQEAARAAVLSSFWKDIWFSLTKLSFDRDFFDYLCLKYSDDEGSDSVSHIFGVVNKILMRHNGPVHKIVFDFDGDILDYLGFSKNIDNLLGDNLNQWFLLLPQNGVEEIDISSFRSSLCLVPNCIFSCPTLKRLKLSNVCVKLVNAYVLPNVTSLDFEYVLFLSENCSDYVGHLPKLEDLSLCSCGDIFYFNIVAAPKRCCLDVLFHYSIYFNPKEMLINFDLGRISSLDLECTNSYFEMLIEELNTVGQPIALNVEHLKLCIYTDICLRDDINPFIHLMQACPKLCELDICYPEVLKLNPDDFMLMEELSSVALTQKMLRTLKFSECHGWRSEMQSIKLFLACFPGIEKVVITRSRCNRPSNDFSIMQELLHFPRASMKAEIFYI